MMRPVNDFLVLYLDSIDKRYLDDSTRYDLKLILLSMSSARETHATSSLATSAPKNSHAA